MKNFVEGDIVIVDTGQSGCIAQLIGKDVWVLLKNNDIFVGLTHQLRYPQGQDDLEACPFDVDRLVKPIPRSEDND